MSKITLANLANLQNETTAVNTINANSAIIQTAMDNTLSRDGTLPNTMSANLDMNSFRILNLIKPAQASEPLRLQDLSDFVGGGIVTNIPAGGNTRDVLAKNSSTNFDASWSTVASGLTAGLNMVVTGTSPATIATKTNPVFSTSVQTPLLINTGTLTLPTSTDTLVGRATTDTLTNKTITSPNINITTAGSLIIADGGFVLQSSGDLTKQLGFSLAGITTGTTRTLTVPNITDTLVTKTSTDTFTNKTFDTAGTGNVFKINTQSITSVTGASAAVVVAGTTTTGTVPRWSSGILTTGAMADDGTNIVIPGNLQVPTISGGSAAASTFILKSTTNASPSGDSILIQGQNITLSGKSGLGTVVNIGTAGASGVTGFTLAGASGGATTIVPTAVASGTLTLPAATDTLIGKATTDTLTNKTFNTTATGNNFQLNGSQVNNTNDILNLIGSTQGQILYRNATQWTVLSPGTSGQFLQTQGAAANPLWQTGGGATTSGNRTLLNTLTASASASLADTTSFTSTYTRYDIEFESILPTTSGGDMRFRVNIAGVQTGATYVWASDGCNGGGTNLTSGGTTNTFIPLNGASANTVNNSGQGFFGKFTYFNPSGTTAPKTLMGSSCWQGSASTFAEMHVAGYYSASNAAVTGFEVTNTAGTIASGTIKIYGIVT